MTLEPRVLRACCIAAIAGLLAAESTASAEGTTDLVPMQVTAFRVSLPSWPTNERVFATSRVVTARRPGTQESVTAMVAPAKVKIDDAQTFAKFAERARFDPVGDEPTVVARTRSHTRFFARDGYVMAGTPFYCGSWYGTLWTLREGDRAAVAAFHARIVATIVCTER
jgi:hypothetical protein